MKLLSKAHREHQFLTQPHILTERNFENVFFPRPLISYAGLRPGLHMEDSSNFITSDSLPLLSKNIQVFER
jgi:hypothetical protein